MVRTIFVLLAVIAAIAMILSSPACPKECGCSETVAECSRKQLRVIPEGIPESILRLGLDDNQIIEVDAAKLSRLHSLQTLSLQMNRLSQIKSLTFVNNTKLTRLHLANNQIETINDHAFQGLLSLTNLDLTNNKLSDITGKFHIAGLQRLLLSHNQITSLQDETLKSVRSLHYLILSNNKISYISKSSLDGMTELSYLALHGNPIKYMDNIFGGLPALSYLDISACQLTHIPKGLPWMLRELKISDNNLTTIEDQDLIGTRYLAHLIADNNQIQVIYGGALLYTPYMTEVNVGYNQIKWLPSIPKNIETFIADNNEIQQLSESSFAHDCSMKMLSLRNNNISEIPPHTFSRLPNLNMLILGHNGIKHLQNMSFAGLRQLTALNLELNPIEKIDTRAFGGLQRVEKLNLSNINSNQTVMEGAIFQDLPSLASLYLQSSPSIISDILNSSDLQRSLQHIQHLDLTNGSVETVSMEFKHYLSNLKSIQFSDNPWHCDSELVGLHKWIHESPELFAGSSITCASPNHLRGRAIQNVSLQELTMAAPTERTYVLNHSLEVHLNIATTFEHIMNQTETTTLGDMTQLLQPSSTALIIQVTKSEDVKITPLLQAPDSTTNLQVTTSPAYHTNNFSKEHHQVLNPSTTSDYHHTQEHPTTNPGLTSMGTELPLMPGNVTPALQPPPVEAGSSAVYTRPDNQMPVKSPPHEASSISIPYTSARIPRKFSHSSTAPILSITTITSQTVSSSTLPVWPTSVTNNVPSSSSLTYATKDVYGDRRPHQISTAETPSQRSLSPSMITLPITQLAVSTGNPPSTTTPVLIKVSMLATSIITPSPIATTQELSPTESATPAQIRTPKLQTWSVSRKEVLASIPVREFVNEEAFAGITSVTENTAVPDTRRPGDSTKQALLEEQNSTESTRHNKGDPIKPAVKSENRLPTFSSSGDIKLRVIIITVSTTLLALIVGLFVAVVTIRYCKKRKLVTFEDNAENHTDIQTETSDTVFIISHMEVQQANNLNTVTSWDGKASTTSPKDTSEAESSSRQTKKGLKFSRQSISAVISKTRFDCIKGQTEDDSELLMYSWT